MTLQCDTSYKGLGTVIMQDEDPVAYASRALTDAETRYAQIEKELLAVVYGLEKFHTLTQGGGVSKVNNGSVLTASMTSRST